MKVTIKCLYSCKICGLKDIEVDVPAREQEDVLQWFDKILSPALSRDHRKRTYWCIPKELSDVKVPIGNHPDAKIGEAQRN